ncbi:hypothetical protein BJ875DRAFT_413578 [Amylocarpus encephaloides]|uniref:Vacuolar import and degradation protein 21 n=1 Tax=Amylocarpus encephaloides TaxID=45428 RepID=A0A9P7YUZ5_9HELO|nr:hypothetical protein BJ875DRAFT_413578 [Amylocarpus encephaloides]
MSEVGPADRSRLLRSKRNEISGIVFSRKRKLRELFAVCDNEGPIPQPQYRTPDAHPTCIAETRFLEVTDILKDRLFDESNLPSRRTTRSESAKQRTAVRKSSPENRTAESSRKTKAQRDGSKSRKSRAPTPNGKNTGTPSTPMMGTGMNGTVPQVIIPMERSSSKGSQIDLPPDSAAVLNEIVEETLTNAARPQPKVPDEVVPKNALESERIRTEVGSRPNSPGVDPRKTMPISAEDAAQLPEPLVDGLGSHDTHHQAKTAHLPPREVQEERLREEKEVHVSKRKDKGDVEAALLIINPPPNEVIHTEPLSSPGSTSGALSATTPALHDASTDTSPDNASLQYDVETAEKDDEASTPPELRPTPEEVARQDEHDRLLKAQIDVNRTEILGNSPTDVDNQSRMEEQAASLNAGTSDDPSMTEGDKMVTGDEMQTPIDMLTKEANEVVQDVVKDTDAARTSEDVEMFVVRGPAELVAKEPDTRIPEVPDSENASQTPIDAMEVDPVTVTTVKDSFESTEVLDKTEANPVEQAAQSAPESKHSAEPSTPRRIPTTPVAAPPVLERMTTRVASGAMRHKSVSEILGEIPRPNITTNSDRSLAKINTDIGSAGGSNAQSRSSTPQSSGSRMRSLVNKEKERSKLSSVTFSRRTNKPSSDTALMLSGSQAFQAQDDYLKPLFISSATNDKRGIPVLDGLLASAHKTITTANAYIPIHEAQTTKILKRIYHLQSAGKWSLRQPKRAAEPNRPTTHWDVVLQEVKWMRTDFREERKWKMTAARNLAYDCAEWVEASDEDRKLLQVNAVIPEPSGLPGSAKNIDVPDNPMPDVPHSTPDLVASNGVDSPMDDLDEEPRLNLMETVSPAAIFGLQDDDVVFGLRRSPTADKLLDELPMYGAPLRVPQSDLLTSEIDPDRLWRRPALPLSKYVEGKMELRYEGPHRKKLRYHYDEEDVDEDEVVYGERTHKRPVVPPEMTSVALFDPQHKHIRDRIHSSHQFRPPSEFPMPLQSFFESRVASQWTWDEDNEVKTLVREYSYNWSLISSILTSKSMFSAGAERRTPWECFERWIYLEGLPSDMQKTHYFRAYNTRIEAANRSVMAQAAAVQPQAIANGQIQPPPRRRTTSSVRVERRRNQKHLTLVDAMRKLAKKRETTTAKQQQAAGMAALRKANESQQPAQQRSVHTPQEFSRLKYDRDEQFKERLLQHQARQDAHRKATIVQRGAAPGQQQGALPNGGPQPRPAVPTGSQLPNGTPTSSGQTLTVPVQVRPGQPRPMPSQMGQHMGQQMGQQMQNGLRVPQLPMNGIPHVPHAPMQAMQGQLPMPNPAVSVGLINQAAQTAEQQRAMIQMQQQGKPPGQSPQSHNSPPRGISQNGFTTQNMMAFNANEHRVATPINGMVPSPSSAQHPQAGSPRMGQHPQAGSPRMGQHPQAQGQNSIYITRMEAELKKRYPAATQEQIVALITQQMKQNMQNNGVLAQSAMNAAAGASPNVLAGMNGHTRGVSAGGNESSPQLYAQMLRQQQESQQKAEQARQAASALAVAQGQNGVGPNNGQQAQGHVHRNSSGSAHSVK